MKLPLAGPSSQQRSLPFDAQDLINLFPVLDQEGKDTSALYGTPGLVLFATAGIGPVRGEFAAANGRAFAVSAGTLYEVSSDGTTTPRGTLNTSTGIVSMDENGFQLAIADGVQLYIFTFLTGVFQIIANANLPPVGTVTFIDGYFVTSGVNTGQFNISGLFDGTSWAALDFATAESSPDNLSRVLNAIGQLWLQGTQTIEIWSNTGASAFPFQRISGAKMTVGISAPHTAVEVDNTIMWVGQDKRGTGIVYRASGFTPQRVSTNAIELILQAAPSPSTLRAYTYQEEGHTFYIITGGGLSVTLAYDISTQIWHKRAYLNNGVFEQHLGACSMYAFGFQLIGSRVDGKIYKMNLGLYTDDGAKLKRQRTFPHIYQDGERFKAAKLQIDFEHGVGTEPSVIYAPVALSTNQVATLAYTTGIGDLATVSGTPFVTLNLGATAAILAIGDQISFSGVTAFAGLTSAILNTTHTVYGTPDSTHIIVKLGANATATTTSINGFNINFTLVTLGAPSHGLSNSDTVLIQGCNDVGGIPAASINMQFPVRVVNANVFRVNTPTLATSGVTGGGSSVTYQKIVQQAPVATLEISKDLGRTWSNEYQTSIGKIGEYVGRAVWRRLGYTNTGMTFRVSCSDAVKVAICGAYLT